MEEISGFVDHIVYRNEDNGYTVLVLESDGDEIDCVGFFPVIKEGESLLFHGEFTTHPTYGKQFKVTSHEIVVPSDIIGIERYLGSGAIKGIGVKLAGRIIKHFGEDTLRIIEEEPERLAEVKGISLNVAMDISDQLREAAGVRNAIMFLDKYGISGDMAIRVYKTFGDAIYSILTTNPYKLADEVRGIGFKRADEIAMRAGIVADSEFRVVCGAQYVLNQAAAAGHTYLPKDVFVEETVRLLDVDAGVVEMQFPNMIMEKKVIIRRDMDGNEQVYLNVYYQREKAIAAMLSQLSLDFSQDEGALLKRVDELYEHLGMEPDEYQKQAVLNAQTTGFFVLTGGPGTGKTSTVKIIMEMFLDQGLEVELCAPTGRAAKRLSETTGLPAKTIHRLLEVTGGMEAQEIGGIFARNSDNPLECDVLIVDEVSMVDVNLMYYLLKAIPAGTRLILVGDENQLPSVGPGNVLGDILLSGCFKSIRLNHIFRQATTSNIIVNAHKILGGEKVDLSVKYQDFFLMSRDNPDEIISVMLSLILKNLPAHVGASSMDIQVLTPTRKGLLGVERLNKELQQYINPPDNSKNEIVQGNRTLREGDKVMQIKNNYQLKWRVEGKYAITVESGMGIFNGDVGIIDEIDKVNKLVTVIFDENHKVDYEYGMLEELELAYAMTVHKSQGSEYPAVVMPLFPGPTMLMNKNILYTAITRAKKCVCMVGVEDVFHMMENSKKSTNRYSGLKERILELDMM